MGRKEDTAYAEWLAEIKAKHPDVAPQLDSFAETEAGREIFRGGLREADYYRRLNEIRDEKAEIEAKAREIEEQGQQQISWWQEAKPEFDRAIAERQEYERKLEAYENKLKEIGVEPKVAVPTAQPPAVNRELEDLKSRVSLMDAAYPQVMMGLFQAQQAAIREGLQFDPNQVIQKVYKDKVDPLTAFNQLVAPQREEQAKALLQQELEKAKEEGRREALSKLSGPDRAVRPSGPSIVDALRGDATVLTDERSRRDAAVRDWMELEAAGQV